MTNTNDQTILITGGAGFIGSNLCDYFLNKNYRVKVLDNFSTGYKHNLEDFLNNDRFTLIEGDIRDLETCRQAVENTDYVLHQAALGSVPRSLDDPITTNEVNISGFLNMLVASRDAKVKRFVYAASSSTYGDSTDLPKVEDKIGKPLSPYAITKYVDELYAGLFSETFGLETIGLRYFNVFGPKQDPKGAYAAVFPALAANLINHQSPVINGDGSFSRDFTYIDNVVLMNELAMTTKNESAINTIYNVAVGESTTINELANYLKEFFSHYDSSINEIEIKHGPDRLGDIPHSLASIDKAVKLLGYQPICQTKEGFKKTVDWYWQNKNRL